jgi:hypothetical protein
MAQELYHLILKFCSNTAVMAEALIPIYIWAMHRPGGDDCFYISGCFEHSFVSSELRTGLPINTPAVIVSLEKHTHTIAIILMYCVMGMGSVGNFNYNTGQRYKGITERATSPI